jgi:hypothetical protein
MLQKIFGKVQFALFNTGNPAVCESFACNEARETRLEKTISFAHEHGINYGQPMSYWMLGRHE